MTRCPERDSFGNQCYRERGHKGEHVSTSYERDKMTYADWLRDELPTLLKGTEYWKGAECHNETAPCHRIVLYTFPVVIEITENSHPELSMREVVDTPEELQALIEACALIQTIEAKRREML